ncbi:hypothetical protein HYU14_04595 [Candidatus Woesearchaeota archaeon]|nr:hypothetical protein [Candidatus Woesearchaeota archaeon]
MSIAKQLLIRDIVFAVIAISLLPIGLAQESDAQASMEADTVTVTSLRFTQFGEFAGDVVFAVKSAFTFDDGATLDLLQERNEELKERQQEWVAVKQKAMIQFKGGNISEESKGDILAIIQEEHEDLIKDHVEVTHDINTIRAEAQAKGEVHLVQKAESAVKHKDTIGLGLGLDIGDTISFIILGSSGGDGDNDSGKAEAITSGEAQNIAEEEFGFETDKVVEASAGGREIFIVTGAESETTGRATLESEFEVWVDKSTGLITKVTINAQAETIDRNGSENEGGGEGVIDGEAGVENSSDNRADTEGLEGGDDGDEAKTSFKVDSSSELSSDAQDTLDLFVESFEGAGGEAEASIEVKKKDGAVTVESTLEGVLTAEQKVLWERLQAEAKEQVESDADSSVKVRIEIEHEDQDLGSSGSSAESNAEAIFRIG